MDAFELEYDFVHVITP